jgi:hypothetical protein
VNSATTKMLKRASARDFFALRSRYGLAFGREEETRAHLYGTAEAVPFRNHGSGAV